MSMNSPSVLKSYVRSVQKMLPCSGKKRKMIVYQITKCGEDYLKQNPDADLEALQAHLGTPQEIAASCIDEQETLVLLKKVRSGRKRFFIAAAAMAVVFLICVGLAAREMYLSRLSRIDDAKVIVIERFMHE